MTPSCVQTTIDRLILIQYAHCNRQHKNQNKSKLLGRKTQQQQLTLDKWACILFLASTYSATRSENAELTAFHSLAIDVVTPCTSWSICERISRDAALSLWERRMLVSLNWIHVSGTDTLHDIPHTLSHRRTCYRHNKTNCRFIVMRSRPFIQWQQWCTVKQSYRVEARR